MPSNSLRYTFSLPLLTAAALALAACAHSPQSGTEAPPAEPPTVTPTGRGGPGTAAIRVRYEGTLPCADCAGIQAELLLLANGSYTLRETYQGKGDTVRESRGRYNLTTGTPADANATVLQLTPEEGDSRSFLSTHEGQELHELDKNRAQLPAPLGATLKLTGGTPLQP